MSTPLSLVASGSFTSDGAARTIEFPQKIDYFKIVNRSTWGTSPSAVVQSEWFRGYAAGQSKSISEGASNALTAASTAAGGLGFTEIDESVLTPGPLVATGTAITAANPAVVSDATSPAVGNVVRMINTTGMLQIAGMEFEVTAVTASTNFTLGYLDASGFAAPATNADYRVVANKRYLPTRRFITSITQAANAVITTSVSHGYAVGDKIRVNCPDANFGMTEINGLVGTVTAVTDSTITTDIDSSSFTAFAFPTSAIAATGITHATVTPFGEVATSLASALYNRSFNGLRLDTAVVGADTNVMDWVAYARDYTV